MKTILYILILNIVTISFAQNPQLFENDWYLQKLVINNEDYYPPNNNEIQEISLKFAENPPYINTEVCSGIASVIDVIDNESFHVPGFAIIDIECSLQESAEFENYYFNDFFHWQGPHTFGYNIEIGTNNSKVLTLTNEANDQAIYGNESLSISNKLAPQFSIHPNPAKTELFLSSKSGVGKVNVQIFNIEGKLLMTKDFNFEKQASLNVSNLSSGFYFLNLSDENGNVAVKKFIKE